MMNQDWLNREFAESSSQLVNLICPYAQPEDRLKILAAIAALASNIQLQTVNRLDADAMRWGGEQQTE